MLITLLREMARRLPLLGNDDEGATAVEYALLVGLIAVIIISSVTLLGGNIDAMFDDVANQLGGGTDDTTTP
ncbi:Flp family type IVb pilin [Symbioplanes lichenis]|uniref:Flp family type IVb pilin n=1 Tax=Symbioplanes lichenis TaxID=1629072 RepID=UPI0027390318|nr:Flp family type IVb pilin [Actinoplanes lichenis]